MERVVKIVAAFPQVELPRGTAFPQVGNYAAVLFFFGGEKPRADLGCFRSPCAGLKGLVHSFVREFQAAKFSWFWVLVLECHF